MRKILHDVNIDENEQHYYHIYIDFRHDTHACKVDVDTMIENLFKTAWHKAIQLLKFQFEFISFGLNLISDEFTW